MKPTPLTDEEIVKAYCAIGADKEWAIRGMNDATPFARAIEAAVLEKVTKVDVEHVAWMGAYDHSDLYCIKPVQADVIPLVRASALAALKQQLDATSDAYNAMVPSLQEQRDNLRTQLAEAQADAARYRFLAERCRSTSEHWGGRWSIIVDGPAPKTHNSEDDFDAAIDVALKGDV